jgi:hypothetical protein
MSNGHAESEAEAGEILIWWPKSFHEDREVENVER